MARYGTRGGVKSPATDYYHYRDASINCGDSSADHGEPTAINGESGFDHDATMDGGGSSEHTWRYPTALEALFVSYAVARQFAGDVAWGISQVIAYASELGAAFLAYEEHDAPESAPESDEEPVGNYGAFATFREFYRSRDGRITVFEDAEGHLTAVDSSRLV